MKLIQDCQTKGKDGRITGWYIKVNFIWSREVTTLRKIHSVEVTRAGEIHTVETNEGNALSDNSINALSDNSINALSDNTSSSEGNGKITHSQFDIFWKIYPNKKEKGKSKSRWDSICRKKVKDRPNWDVIISAIEAQKKTPRWQDSNYIPHAATWLNPIPP